jgi:hypothetical protein
MTVTRYLGPAMAAYADLSYTDVRARTDDPDIRRAREYQEYTVQVGFRHSVSPAFSWEAAVGWSRIEGDSRGNQSPDEGAPVASFKAAYTGPNWGAGVAASSNLGEYDLLGENTGLARTHRASAYYHYEFDQRTYFRLNAAWVKTNYRLDPNLLPPTVGRDRENYSFSAELGYRLTRHARLALRYRYLEVIAENEEDGRKQNRILVILSLLAPEKW